MDGEIYLAFRLEVDLLINGIELINVMPLIGINKRYQLLDLSLILERNRNVVVKSVDPILFPQSGIINQ